MCTPLQYLAWLFKAEALDVAVDPEAWALLTSNFSSSSILRFSARPRCLDLHNYDRAVAARDVLATELAASGAPYLLSYDLQDLLSFAWVAQYDEDAVPCGHWPPVALPVSVRADLGLEVPVVVGMPRKQPRVLQQTAGGLLVRPLRAPLLARALPLILPWCGLAVVSRLCKCYASGLGVAGLHLRHRVQAQRKMVADHVATMMRTQRQPVPAALLAAGVPRSTVLRIAADAWDWVDKLPLSLLCYSDRNLTWTVLRLSVKMMLSDERGDAALKLLAGRSRADKIILRRLECKVLMTMESAAEPGRLQQPLAQRRSDASLAGAGATPLPQGDMSEYS